MPAINFMARYADDVEALTKRQTVRRKRKHPVIAGDILYLYTGMRTRNCRRLLVTKCRATRDIHVIVNGALKLDGQAIYRKQWDEFARADGLKDWAELLEFITQRYGLPFHGQVIYW